MKILKEDKRYYYLGNNNEKIYITDDNGKQLFEGENFVDISYESRVSASKALSNLFHYDFRFRSKAVKSMEGLLQSLKFKDKIEQSMVWRYDGVDAYHIRAASPIDWRENHLLYWQGQPINRLSIEYQIFLNNAYQALYNSNPLFRNALNNTVGKQLLHSIGKTSPLQTILTPDEYIYRLMIIRDMFEKKREDRLLELSESFVKKYGSLK